MSGEVLSPRAINRALLSRQLLLDRPSLPSEHRRRLSTINGILPGSVLIDGFVAGMWRLARSRDAATLTIELFGPAADRDALVREAARVLAFCAPGTSHDIRFGPLPSGVTGS